MEVSDSLAESYDNSVAILHGGEIKVNWSTKTTS